MKRFASVLLLIGVLFFGFSKTSHAYPDISTNEVNALPFTYNGVTYSDVFYIDGYYGAYVYYYNYVSGDLIATNDNGALTFGTSTLNPGYLCATNSTYYSLPSSYYVGSYCGFAGLYNDGQQNATTWITSNHIITSKPIYDASHNVILAANWSAPSPYQLTINLNPATGGSVSSNPTSDFSCSNGTCTGNFSGNVLLTATPSTNWAFSYWDDGTTNYNNNPKTFSITENTTLTAKFFKTFTNRVGNFQASTGSTIDTGQCVPYARYETGAPIYGDAYTWYQQAIDANYATSATVPRVGSIIVFDIQGNMTSGHVGIVTAINGNSLGIRSQNWHDDLKVSDDVIDVSTYTIKGYIYYTP